MQWPPDTFKQTHSMLKTRTMYLEQFINVIGSCAQLQASTMFMWPGCRVTCYPMRKYMLQLTSLSLQLIPTCTLPAAQASRTQVRHHRLDSPCLISTALASQIQPLPFPTGTAVLQGRMVGAAPSCFFHSSQHCHHDQGLSSMYCAPYRYCKLPLKTAWACEVCRLIVRWHSYLTHVRREITSV